MYHIDFLYEMINSAEKRSELLVKKDGNLRKKFDASVGFPPSKNEGDQKFKNDLKDYISKSVNSFTFKDFDYGKKWFSVLQKTNWNNIDWICKNIKYLLNSNIE